MHELYVILGRIGWTWLVVVSTLYLATVIIQKVRRRAGRPSPNTPGAVTDDRAAAAAPESPRGDATK